MKKFNPNKNIIILLILVIIVVAAISLTAANRAKNGKANIVQSIINDTVGVVDAGLSAPGRWLNGGVQTVSNLLSTYDENEQLKTKIDQYDELKRKLKNQERKIDQLEEELKLNKALNTYEKITASVITRSPDTWQDILIVDKGSQDGVNTNMAVMAQKGLIGRVVEVNGHSSKVELLTSNNKNTNRFPVRITSQKGEAFGVLSSYDAKTQQLKVTEVTGKEEIKEGDVVQTSGLGGNSPANLVIGTVAKVQVDSYGLNRDVYVKPYAKMHDLSVVTIIQRTTGGAEE